MESHCLSLVIEIPSYWLHGWKGWFPPPHKKLCIQFLRVFCGQWWLQKCFQLRMPFPNLSKHTFCQQTVDVLLKPCDEDADVDGENNSERYVFFFFFILNGRMCNFSWVHLLFRTGYLWQHSVTWEVRLNIQLLTWETRDMELHFYDDIKKHETLCT